MDNLISMVEKKTTVKQTPTVRTVATTNKLKRKKPPLENNQTEVQTESPSKKHKPDDVVPNDLTGSRDRTHDFGLIQPTKEDCAVITGLIIEDMTNYVSVVETSKEPVLNAISSQKNLKENVSKTLELMLKDDSSDSDVRKKLRELNAQDRAQMINKVFNSVADNNYESLIDKDFNTITMMPHMSLLASLLKTSDKDLVIKRLRQNMDLPTVGVSYISSQMREVNPESQSEDYCANSYLTRKNVMSVDNEVSKHMKINNCWAYKMFGITLKSFDIPLETLNKETRRKCVLCYFNEYTSIFVESAITNCFNVCADQLFCVKAGIVDGYVENVLISQRHLPIFKGPMKINQKSHYIVVQKKMTTRSGFPLNGLEEISSIHFH